MPKKKQTKIKTVKKKKEDNIVVGYYWDGLKSWVLTKKLDGYYQYNGHRTTAQSSIDRKSKAGL
jgi:hypothetical protein